MKKKIIIAGGTGFLGLRLSKFLVQKNYEVVVLGRHVPKVKGEWRYCHWNAHSLGDWSRELNGAIGIVNLAGRSVDCIKTPDNCDDILRSRVESTRVLGQAIGLCVTKPKVWVQMSTAHIYGDPVDRVCHDDSALGYGLAPTVGQAWEEEFNKVKIPNLRKVILRTSFVLGKTGGALSKLGKLTKYGLGGTIGKGNQGISWIHEDDMNRIFWKSLTEEEMNGVYIATSPNPVPNMEFMKLLRRSLKIKVGLPAYSWMVKIVAPLILRTDPELALYGRYCKPMKLIYSGFEFKYPELSGAFNEIYQK